MVAYAYDLEAFAIVVLTVLIFAVFSAWLYFLIYTRKTFKRVPKLESANEQQQGDAVFISEHKRYPKVMVILPARNEEKYMQNVLIAIFFVFISSIVDAAKKNAVYWKDRQYTIK